MLAGATAKMSVMFLRPCIMVVRSNYRGSVSLYLSIIFCACFF